MRSIIAVDIGTGARGSGAVCFGTAADEHRPVSADNTHVVWAKMAPNPRILHLARYGEASGEPVQWVFEGVSSYGKGIGESTISTVLWIGRMIGTIETRRDLGDPVPALVLRRTVAAHLVGARRRGDPTMDSMICRAVIERFGGMGAARKDVVGTKAKPGPLYGFKQDIWSAMAVGIAFAEGAQAEEIL